MSNSANRNHYLVRLVTEAKLPGYDKLTLDDSANLDQTWQAISESCETSEEELVQLVSERFQFEVANLDTADPVSTKLIPGRLAREFNIFPVSNDYKHITIATSDPFSVEMERIVQMTTSRKPVSQIIGPNALEAAIQRQYSPDREAERLFRTVPGMSENSLHIVDQENQDQEHDTISNREAQSSPIVNLTNLIIRKAIERGASDIHLQPTTNGAIARFRVDGVLADFMKLPREVLSRVISRIKIIGGMDITIRYVPQDGRTRVNNKGINYDLRISTVPAGRSEKAVIRIPAGQSKTGLDGLSIPPRELSRFRSLMKNREGIVVVTGPTGSGKTTTMYSALQDLSSAEVNIMTVEDPVEYEISGFTQIQVDRKQGITFASAMRAILRQDPDIIFVGEIRDQETAEIAVQASLTGHFVLATLHTNSAVGAIRRLTDLGLDSTAIGDTLRGSLAQRLARKLCEDCAVPTDGKFTPVEQQQIDSLGIQPTMRAVGCESCGQTGYRGRIPLIEVFAVDQDLSDLIHAGAPSSKLQQAAIASDMREIKDVALERVQKGETTIDEIGRVLGDITPVDSEKKSVEPTAKATSEQPSGASDDLKVVANDNVHVLVVDDDGANRTIARALLEREGYAVTEATDGSVALELLKAGSDYTLLLLDLDMPNVGGREVLRSVRSNMSTAALPIIVLTGSSDSNSEIEIMESGADDYIRKPLEPSRFLARVGATIRRSRA